MAVTRSWERTVAVRIETEKIAPRERHNEWPFLLGATLLVAWGLALVFLGKRRTLWSRPRGSAVANCLI